MADKYTILKLRSGEELIGKISAKSKNHVTLFRPLYYRIMPVPSLMGPRNYIAFKNFDETNDLDIKIHQDFIMMDYSPKPELVAHYLEHLEKQDVARDIAEELANDPEALDSFLQNTIEEQLSEDTVSNEMDEELSDPDNVQMNFLLSPRMFMDFLAQGIVGLNEENNGMDFDADEFMSSYNEMKDDAAKKKPRKKKRSSGEWDFGDQFDNWNPEP